jgi:hypothetical protein
LLYLDTGKLRADPDNEAGDFRHKLASFVSGLYYLTLFNRGEASKKGT